MESISYILNSVDTFGVVVTTVIKGTEDFTSSTVNTIGERNIYLLIHTYYVITINNHMNSFVENIIANSKGLENGKIAENHLRNVLQSIISNDKRFEIRIVGNFQILGHIITQSFIHSNRSPVSKEKFATFSITGNYQVFSVGITITLSSEIFINSFMNS